MVCETFSWLLHDIGEPNTLWAAPQVGLGCLRKVRHREQASKQYKQRSSMVPALVPASRLLPWAPAFTSRSKGLLPDGYEMNPSKAATGHRACPSNRRATQNINMLGRPRETKRAKMRDSKCGSLWHPGGGRTTYSTSSQMTGATPLIKTSGAIRRLFLRTTSENPSLSASRFCKRSLIYSLKPQILQPGTKRLCWDDPKEILCPSLMPHFVALYSRQTQTLLSTILRVCVPHI